MVGIHLAPGLFMSWLIAFKLIEIILPETKCTK